jgi:hypothetical protein
MKFEAILYSLHNIYRQFEPAVQSSSYLDAPHRTVYVKTNYRHDWHT